MIVTSTDIQNNFGKYLEMALGQEFIITKNGTAVARLVGIIPANVNEKAIKDERMARQSRRTRC